MHNYRPKSASIHLLGKWCFSFYTIEMILAVFIRGRNLDVFPTDLLTGTKRVICGHILSLSVALENLMRLKSS